MLLLAMSTLLDYLYGFGVASPNRRKAKFFLWLSVINNLGILGVFKYYNFFANQFQKGFDLLGIHTNLLLLNFALPIGISFYTFHGMSYIFDIYRGKQRPISNFVDYAVFVSFFPLLVAGPIERASHLLPQVQKARKFNYTQAVDGCRLILWGMFKKIVIADSLAIFVDNLWLYSNFVNYNGASLVVGAIAFSFQIYGDFSGYSDIALGTAKLFGFELLSNFKFPYFSRDIAEFWRRWHLSLSSWFKDYLYIPLGGSKNGKSKAVRNTFIIFLVSGFWHGASWNFIVWGFIHACGFLPLLLLNRNRQNVSDVVAQERILPSVKEIWQMGLTFTFVTIAWLFFRAKGGVTQALLYLTHATESIIQHPGQFFIKVEGVYTLGYILVLVFGDWIFRRNERSLRISNSILINWLIMILVTFITLNCLLNSFEGKPNSFIYFEF